MAEYLYPGVYVEEVPRGPRPIEGVPTSTAAMLGVTERGPVVPRQVASAHEYARWFGGSSPPAELMPAVVRGFFDNGGQSLWVCRVVSATATTAQARVGDYLLAAPGPGAWAARLWVKLSPGSTRDGQGTPVGFRLRIALFAPGDTPGDCFANAANSATPLLVEDHDDLVTEARSIDYFARRLAESALIELRSQGNSSASPPDFDGVLPGGSDGTTIEATDYAPALATLESHPDIALLYAPAADESTQRLLVAHCEQLKYRFAVLDAPRGVEPGTLALRSRVADTACAAYYAPWLEVAHDGATLRVPPGGHVLGVYTRTDLARGVHRAPANEELRGVTALEYAIDDRQQEALTPRGVNVIRSFPGRGIRVWGARTLASQAEWKYVNVRRQLIYLQHSIESGTQWAVFEPNGEALWTQVQTQVENFLLEQWRGGALQGSKPEQAFFVRCDRTTMTADDIAQGMLICVVGVAQLKPAEFAILRIAHRVSASA